MTVSPEATNNQIPKKRRHQRLTLYLWLGLVLLLMTGASFLVVQIFLDRLLRPQIQYQVSQFLERPLLLGEVDSFSLNTIQFGLTQLPATPTDPDRATVQAVQAQFNPFRFLQDKTLELQITLIKPQVYIEQDPQGRWIELPKKPKKKGEITVDVQTIKVKNVALSVASRNPQRQLKAPIQLSLNQGTFRLWNDYHSVAYELNGDFQKGGNFDIVGEAELKKFNWDNLTSKLSVVAKNVNLAELSRFLPPLALTITQGQADAKLELDVKGYPFDLQKTPPKIAGVAKVNNVTAKLNFAPILPIATQAQGILQFQDYDITLTPIIAQLGKIPVQLEGNLGLKTGFDLAAKIERISLPPVLESFKLGKLPVNVDGDFKVNAQIRGKERTIITGNLSNICALNFPKNNPKLCSTIVVDRLPLQHFLANFTLFVTEQNLVIEQFTAQPRSGGTFTGKGRTKWGKETDSNLTVIANNISGDAISRLYNLNLPPTLSRLSGKAQFYLPVTNFEKPENNLKNLQATVTSAVILGGGAIAANNFKIKDQQWLGTIRAIDVPIAPFLPFTPAIKSQIGNANGLFDVTGKLGKKEGITIEGNGNLTVAGGKIEANNVRLQNNQITATVIAKEIESNRFIPRTRNKKEKANLVSFLPPLGKVNGVLNLQGNLTGFSPENLTGKGLISLGVAGGVVNVTGFNLKGDNFLADVQVGGVPFAPILRPLPLNFQLDRRYLGTLDGPWQIKGNLNTWSDFKTYQANGITTITNLAGGKAKINFNLNEGNWLASIQATKINSQRLTSQIPPDLHSTLGVNFIVTGNLSQMELNNLTGKGVAQITNLAGGEAKAALELNQGNWLAVIQARNLASDRLTPSIPVNTNSRFGGDFQLTGSINDFSLTAIQGQGVTQITNLGGGITKAALNLNQGVWSASVQAVDVQLHQFISEIPLFLRGKVVGNFDLEGNVKDWSLNAIRATGSGILNLASGQVKAQSIVLNQGNLQAIISPNNLPLTPFSSELRGKATGFVNASINLPKLFQLFNHQTDQIPLKATGQITLSEGVSLVKEPLQATFAFNNGRLGISQINAGDRLQAQGIIIAQISNPLQSPPLSKGGVKVENFDLTVVANDFDLQELRQEAEKFISFPVAFNNVIAEGSANFNGRVTGNLTTPNLAGNLTLNNFTVNRLTFSPNLAGGVSFDRTQGLNLNLRGEQDILQIALNSQFKPTNFEVKLGQITAKGKQQGNTLISQISNIPLNIIKTVLPPTLIPASLAKQPLFGDLSGDFNLNLDTWGMGGTVAINKPVLGPFAGDHFSGQINYINDTITLTNGIFQEGVTQYGINGQLVAITKNPYLQAQVLIPQGDIQDVLTTFKIYELGDFPKLLDRFTDPPIYGNANDIQTSPIGLENNASIRDRLFYLSERLAWQRQQQEKKRGPVPIPNLAEAKGNFNGAINIGGFLTKGLEGISAQFAMNGENWQWGPYYANQATVKGEFEKGILTVLPVEFKIGDGSLLFSGSFGAETISGQLQIANLPISLIQDLITLPPAIGFGGKINASAALAGNQTNPQARGSVTITDASINDTPVTEAKGSFSYNNARLNFAANSILAENGTPLTLIGSIPYKLPLPQATPPDNDQFSLKANLQNDGLNLLNIVTRQQIQWQGGAGNLDLEVAGRFNSEKLTIESLITKGVATVENGVIGSRVLPEPITEINGTILFNFDQVEVSQLTGKYGGGDLIVSGIIPTYQPLPIANPLAINLGKLALNFKGLFKGEIQGNMQFVGSLLEPKLAGVVTVNNGNLQLIGAAGGGLSSEINEVGSWLELTDLQVILGENFAIQQQPFLSFTAGGTLNVRGYVNQLLPEGEIILKTGFVNLFTTQFRLEGGYPNLARFLPNSGLDPELDLRLIGSAIEAKRRDFTVNSLTSEVNDDILSNVGTAQTIRVEAKVLGFASELVETLKASPATARPRRKIIELGSTPSRSETEIIALLGGSFVNSIAGGDNTALVGGLANVAGTAILGGLQNNIATAFGLTEFRIFPSEVINDDGRTGQLGVALEAGTDIGRRFSVSALQYLTPPEQPSRFNIRYRINDSFTLRGSTDFAGDSRASIEFETRF